MPTMQQSVHERIFPKSVSINKLLIFYPLIHNTIFNICFLPNSLKIHAFIFHFTQNDLSISLTGNCIYL